MPLPFPHHIGKWACRIVTSPAGPVGWPAGLPRFRVVAALVLAATWTEKIERDSIWTDERQRQTYGNWERYFFTQATDSYGILTDERNPYVLLQQSTEIRLWVNGNVMLETRCQSIVKGVNKIGLKDCPVPMPLLRTMYLRRRPSQPIPTTPHSRQVPTLQSCARCDWLHPALVSPSCHAVTPVSVVPVVTQSPPWTADVQFAAAQ